MRHIITLQNNFNSIRMRNPLLILVAFIFYSCSPTVRVDYEQDVSIICIDSLHEKGKGLLFTDSMNGVKLSKDFWNYFIRTHPVSSSIIFLRYRFTVEDELMKMPDSSYSYFDNKISFLSLPDFENLLADSAGGLEKKDHSFWGMYILPDSGANEKDEARIGKKMNDFTINSNVERDFKFFKKILRKDKASKHYIIVFKKRFAETIYNLYK